MAGDYNFVSLCESIFGKLLHHFDFSLAETKGPYLRYESRKVYVEIGYDEREGEIFVYIGELINGKYTFELDFKHEFTLNELLSEVCPEKVYKSKIFRKANDIEAELYRLSRLLEDEGENILNGEVKIFSKLLQNRIKVQEKQDKSNYIADIKEKAEAAFKNGDYKSTVSLYKIIEPDLNPLNKKRYEIAMRKYSEDGDTLSNLL